MFYLFLILESLLLLHLDLPTGPFTSNVGYVTALEQIAQVRATLMAMREEENSLRHNLGIFKIEQPVSKDLQNLEKVTSHSGPLGTRHGGGRGWENGFLGPWENSWDLRDKLRQSCS